MIGHVWHWIAGVAILLAVVGAASRILSMKESPALIKNAATALANLFKGAFGQ